MTEENKIFDHTFFARVLEQSPAPMIITDLKGSIMHVNAKFLEFTGFKKQELMGKNAHVLSDNKTPIEVYQELWKDISNGKTWQGELLNRRKNGEAYWELISIAPLKDEGGATTHFIGVWQDATACKQREENLEKEAAFDELTGAFNRRYILRSIKSEHDRMTRYNRTLSGIMVDLDNFKMINDEYGHLTGDAVLKTFVRMMKATLRTTDIVGRYGGDEFIVILPETDLKTVSLIAERIKKMLSEYAWNILGLRKEFGASFGVFSPQSVNPENMQNFIANIDEALLQAKSKGKNQIIIFGEIK
jgi:diguanylate cyclase (GGDEF)-like protein/PAS domain S-box-containing protein